MRSVATNSRRARAFLACCLALSACNKSEEHKGAVEKDGGAEHGDKASALDPELAQAMAAASVGAAPGSMPAQEGGPPPNGIFQSPAAADKEAPSAAAPRLVLGSEGSDPKLTFSPARLEAGSKRSGKVQVSVQQGQSGGLPIEFTLALESQKPKEGEAAPDLVKMSARVSGASVPVQGVGKEIEGAIAKLKGARIEYLVAPDGAGTGYKTDLPKGTAGDLALWLESLRDTLALVTLPMPSKAVGSGAYWMVTSREGVLGLDLVTYRLVKVEEIKDGVATLSVNTKRYAASAALNLPGLPPNAPREMSEFQNVSDAKLQFKPGNGFPLGGEVTSALALGLGAAPGPNQRGQQQALVIQSRATLSFGDGAAAK